MSKTTAFTHCGIDWNLKVEIIEPRGDRSAYLKIQQDAGPNYRSDIIIIQTSDEARKLVSMLLQYSKMIS